MNAQDRTLQNVTGSNLGADGLSADEEELCLAGLVAALEIFLAWFWRDAFRPLLRAR